MMMRAGLGRRMDDDRPRPELFRAGPSMGDGGGAVHAGRLRRVEVELAGVHDPYSVKTPFLLVHASSPDLRRPARTRRGNKDNSERGRLCRKSQKAPYPKRCARLILTLYQFPPIYSLDQRAQIVYEMTLVKSGIRCDLEETMTRANMPKVI
jgi:hypothetical protein